MKWIVADDQPFTIIENKLFQKLLVELNPKVEKELRTADTITSDLVNSFEINFNDKKKKLKVIILFYFFFFKFFKKI